MEKDQAKTQCDQMAAAQTGSHMEIGQLKVANEKLQQENNQLRQELLATRATPRPVELPPASSASSTTSSSTGQRREIVAARKEGRASQGQRTGGHHCQTKESRADHQNAMVDGLMLQIRATEDRYDQLTKSQTRSHLPTHQEMGGHRPTFLAADSGLSLPVMPGGSQGPQLCPLMRVSPRGRRQSTLHIFPNLPHSDQPA